MTFHDTGSLTWLVPQDQEYPPVTKRNVCDRTRIGPPSPRAVRLSLERPPPSKKGTAPRMVYRRNEVKKLEAVAGRPDLHDVDAGQEQRNYRHATVRVDLLTDSCSMIRTGVLSKSKDGNPCRLRYIFQRKGAV